MINNIVHICWGDAAYGCLKERSRLQGDSVRIVSVLDNLQVGHLLDADSFNPTLRLRLFEEILISQPWYDEVKKYKSALIKNQLNRHKSFLRTINNKSTKVIWVGNSVSNRLMLSMISYLSKQSTMLMVVDISKIGAFSPENFSDVSHISPFELLDLYPEPLSFIEREELSKFWLYWRESFNGWRQIDKCGNVVDCSFDYLDKLILDAINRKDKAFSIEIFSDVASEMHNVIPVNIFHWRLKVMIANQKITF